MQHHRPSPRKKGFIRTYSPLRARIPRYPRSRLLRLLAVVAVLTICLAALRKDIIRIFYQPLRNRQTDFARVSSLAELPSPPCPLRILGGGDRDLDIHDRYSYVADLGRGCEGMTRLYEDRTTSRMVVIKSWFLEGRNPLPAELRKAFHGLMRKWPAEIQATLLLAGLESDGLAETAHNKTGFLPAVDYFLAVSTDNDGGARSHSWRLVTPYVHGGTLDHLANRLRPEQLTPNELDVRFRPSFNGLLAVLESLHSKGYCHDDVKPDNILVPDPPQRSWLLSDLGNVRQTQHPYHDTADWTDRNKQWPDCRANDLRRLLKTYLSFLRAASASQAQFDEDFFTTRRRRRQPWSRLYWDFFVGRPTDAADDLLDASRSSEPEPDYSSRGGASLEPLSYYARNMLAVAATAELACVPHRWSWGLWGWVGWLLAQ